MWKMSVQYKVPGLEPLEHESVPITTRSGLPPPNLILLIEIEWVWVSDWKIRNEYFRLS